jgi:hypothetical protein
MKRVPIDNTYVQALQRFAGIVQDQRNSMVPGGDRYTMYTQTGRKYDKLYQVADGKTDLLFFIERANGAIYGPKNPLQPNPYWWFNTLWTAHLWDWRDFPHPVNDPTVKVIMTYGKEIKHYGLRTKDELVDAVTKMATKGLLPEVLETPAVALDTADVDS